MLLKDMPVFAALTRQMDWLTNRQKVIAHNIANADTPGFTGKDLKPLTFRELVTRPDAAMNVARTAQGHLAPAGADDDGYRRSRSQDFDVSPGGNTITLEDEITKMNDTRMAYDMAVSLYRKNIGMLKMAIGGRGAQ